MIYLIKFTPLEPYTFGTDQTFDYPGSSKTGKESYFVHSNALPEQTTIFGTLRYLVLQHIGLAKENFDYSDEELQRVKNEIGESSFSFSSDDQSFGRIKGISPLFVMLGGEVMVINPFNNRASESGYTPIKMGDVITTSAGDIQLPIDGEYSAKNGYAQGFIRLSDFMILKDIFSSYMIPGNRKTADGASRDNSFFRRELVRMKEGFSFAVLAEAENGTFPAEEIVYMGQKRSAFRVTTVDAASVFGVHAESNPSKIIADAIARAFANCDGSWYYALSDIILEKCAQYSAFSIVEEKYLRILTTDYKAKSIIHKLKRSRERLSSIRAGSVFYAEKPDLALKKSAETAGYNQIVKLGGK